MISQVYGRNVQIVAQPPDNFEISKERGTDPFGNIGVDKIGQCAESG